MFTKRKFHRELNILQIVNFTFRYAGKENHLCGYFPEKSPSKILLAFGGTGGTEFLHNSSSYSFLSALSSELCANGWATLFSTRPINIRNNSTVTFQDDFYRCLTSRLSVFLGDGKFSLALLGHSYGGKLLAEFTRLSIHEVDELILVNSPFRRMSRILEWQLGELGLENLSYYLDPLTTELASEFDHRMNFQSYKGRILCIACEKDNQIPHTELEHWREFLKARRHAFVRLNHLDHFGLSANERSKPDSKLATVISDWLNDGQKQ